MAEKIILITGSTDGIGKQTALKLAESGASVTLHGRDHKRCLETREEIMKRTGNNNIDFITSDISTRDGVKRLADSFLAKHKRLDVLINNAGVFMKERVLTEDGLEMTFAVNHMAYFTLTYLLYPLIVQSAPSRIINVSSIAHQNGRLHFENLQGEKKYEGYSAYSLSKLANLLFTFELAERSIGKNVTVNALHPGVISTKLLKTGFGDYGAPIEEGAETSVYLAISEEVKNVSGKYFIKCKETKCAPQALNISDRQQLWELSMRLAGF